MATEVSYNGDGSDKTFSITFPFLKDSHVKVSVGGETKTVTSDYSISGTVVTFVTAPVSGTANVKLYRDTPITEALYDYTAGSSVKANDLNENQLQALYAIEEAKLVTITSGGITTGSKNDVTVNSDSDWVINNNAVEKVMMADNSVGTAEIETNAVTAVELADNAVDINALANNAVTNPKIAAGAVSLDKLTNSAATGFGFTPVGTVIWYAGSSAPTGYLKANGDAIANGSGTTQSITANFSALYAIVGANLPDLRGEFVRGFDDGKGTDSGRGIRSTQTDQNKQHNHTASSSSSVTDPGHTHSWDRQDATNDSGYRPWPASNNDCNLNVVQTGSSTTGISVSTTTTTANQGGNEARPRNVALLACIKY